MASLFARQLISTFCLKHSYHDRLLLHTRHPRTLPSAGSPPLVDLARHLTGDDKILLTARWCHEALIAVSRDGREAPFFMAWSRAAHFLQDRGVYSGEGGVIGLAAAYAGWGVDYEAIPGIAASIHHEGGGPKDL